MRIHMALVAWLAALGSAGACTPFSSYQSAKLLPPGKTSVTVALTWADSSDGNSNDGNVALGDLMVRHGVSDAVEIGLRYTYAGLLDESGFSVLLADIKGAILPGRLSWALPAGFDYSDGSSHTYQLQPGILGRIPLSSAVDVEMSGKLILVSFSTDVAKDGDVMVAGNLGVRIRPGTRFALHPEIGILVDPEESEFIYQLGLGLTFLP